MHFWWKQIVRKIEILCVFYPNSLAIVKKNCFEFLICNRIKLYFSSFIKSKLEELKYLKVVPVMSLKFYILHQVCKIIKPCIRLVAFLVLVKKDIWWEIYRLLFYTNNFSCLHFKLPFFFVNLISRIFLFKLAHFQKQTFFWGKIFFLN